MPLPVLSEEVDVDDRDAFDDRNVIFIRIVFDFNLQLMFTIACGGNSFNADIDHIVNIEASFGVVGERAAIDFEAFVFIAIDDKVLSEDRIDVLQGSTFTKDKTARPFQ